MAVRLGETAGQRSDDRRSCGRFVTRSGRVESHHRRGWCMAKDRARTGDRQRERPGDLDDVDLAILRTLRADGRTSNADLAATVGVAASTALLRTRALRAHGVVR